MFGNGAAVPRGRAEAGISLDLAPPGDFSSPGAMKWVANRLAACLILMGERFNLASPRFLFSDSPSGDRIKFKAGLAVRRLSEIAGFCLIFIE